MSPWDLEQIPEVVSTEPNHEESSHSIRPRRSVTNSDNRTEGGEVTQDDIEKVIHYSPTPEDWDISKHQSNERYIDDSESDDDDMHERLLRQRDSHCNRIQNAIQALMVESLYLPFSAPVSLHMYPAYAVAVAYPTDLSTILDRVRRRFYRRIDALCWEVRLLEANARAFNKPGSDIVRIGKLLTLLLLEFIRDRSCNDILRLHRSLHITRRVTQSSTSEDDSNQESDDFDVETTLKRNNDLLSRHKRKRSLSPVEDKQIDVVMETHETTNEMTWKKDCDDLLTFVWAVSDAKPFRYNVDTSAYPDYLDYVTQPICLHEIRENLKNNLYDSPEDLAKDVTLMFTNSRSYNTDKKSPIWSMTIRLQPLMEARMKPILQKYKTDIKSLIRSRKKSRRRLRRSSRKRKVLHSFKQYSEDGETIPNKSKNFDEKEDKITTNERSHSESEETFEPITNTRSNPLQFSSNENSSVAKDNHLVTENLHTSPEETTSTMETRTLRRKEKLTRYRESDSEDDHNSQISKPLKKRRLKESLSTESVLKVVEIQGRSLRRNRNSTVKNQPQFSSDDNEQVFINGTTKRRQRQSRCSSKKITTVTSQRSSRTRQRIAYEEFSDSSEIDQSDSNEERDNPIGQPDDLGMSSRGRKRRMSIKAREGRVF